MSHVAMCVSTTEDPVVKSSLESILLESVLWLYISNFAQSWIASDTGVRFTALKKLALAGMISQSTNQRKTGGSRMDKWLHDAREPVVWPQKHLMGSVCDEIVWNWIRSFLWFSRGRTSRTILSQTCNSIRRPSIRHGPARQSCCESFSGKRCLNYFHFLRPYAVEATLPYSFKVMWSQLIQKHY